MFVTVLDTDGSQQVAFHLDEAAIALRLKNKDPAFQAQLKPDQRTAKERAHRVADALAAICKHYKAQLAVENISYRRHSGQPRFSGVGNDNSRSVKELLHYKLALAGCLRYQRGCTKAGLWSMWQTPFLGSVVRNDVCVLDVRTGREPP